jgi:hypothetical protein
MDSIRNGIDKKVNYSHLPSKNHKHFSTQHVVESQYMDTNVITGRMNVFCLGQKALRLFLAIRTNYDWYEICALVGYCAASCGNCLPTFGTTYRSHLHGSGVSLFFLLGILTREDGTDTLSRNGGKQLPHDAT